MRLTTASFDVTLPDGWEAAVQSGTLPDAVRRRAADLGKPVATPPVLHLSTAPMPRLRGDFGSGAVDVLGERDVFIALVEYGRDSLGTPLFDTGPLPRRLRAADFAGDALQRALPGQAGMQRFCTERGRPLCLYVVLGAGHAARRLSARANQALAAIEVVPA